MIETTLSRASSAGQSRRRSCESETVFHGAIFQSLAAAAKNRRTVSAEILPSSR
jgi:hypothetical protein